MKKQKEYLNMNTEKAWNKLYARLDSEKLIPDNTLQAKTSLIGNHKALWLCAAISILIIGIVTLHFNKHNQSYSEQLISQSNNEKLSLVKVLEDGSTVFMAKESSLKYPAHFRKNERVVVLNGEAYFDISKNPDKPFIIETKSVKVEVLGTSFNIKNNKSIPFELSVREGKVKITNKKNGRQEIITKGGIAVLSDSGFDIKYRNCDSIIMKYTSYIKFKDEPLSNIVGVINKIHPSVKIETSSSIGDKRLTVAFANEKPETMVNLICHALNLNYTQIGNRITIKE